LHGYEWVGPSFEVYSKKPTMEKGETILYAKVMAPVRKK
jgi:effector-binding domain-containing protein